MTRRAPMLVALALLGATWSAQAQGIFKCTDARGRIITSDRPIPDCVDRAQKELNPSGTVKREIGPTMTERERVQFETQQRARELDALRVQEERRRDRALLVRYPNPESHNVERAAAVGQIDQIIRAINMRTVDLLEERAKLEQETEFFAKDPSRMPPVLKRRLEQVQEDLAAQGRLLLAQENERRRVAARFEAERVRLNDLWVAPVPASAGLR